MQRWFRLSSLLLVLTAAFSVAQAQVEVRGSLPPGEVRIFVRDSIYRISGTYTIGGTLVIEPGTRVEFMPNGRLIDSTGGRIIADGRASATYNANAVNPLVAPYTGYDDPAYFAAPGVLTGNIAAEPTIHASNYSQVFHVDMDDNNPNLQNLTPGEAIVYYAARLNMGGVISAIRLNPWFREKAGSDINVSQARITFIAGDVNNFSREWGHIIVLPGANAAFFRDVDFVNFRKDTTVDNEPVYLQNVSGNSFTRAQAEAANNTLISETNGSGGALTTYSVRTWLVGCTFRGNMARYNGGAIQIRQAPVDNSGALQLYPNADATYNNLPNYNPTANPFITSPWTNDPIAQNIKAIDQLYNPNYVAPLNDANRQKYDDARVAMYLGRIRQLKFYGNHTLIADVDTVLIGGIRVVSDKDAAATVFGTPGRSQKNMAAGGAVYISGRTPMIVGLGINDFQGKDTILFDGNYAENRQPATPNNGVYTMGAKGGALYVGDNTSLMVAGRYTNNHTHVPYITDSTTNATTSLASYSHGGAIYANNNAWTLYVRGGLDNNPPTHFTNNTSGRGGAIYTAYNANVKQVSPHIGGSDGIINARNQGYNIKFRNNMAVASGGAIHTERNMYVYGAGGASGSLWVYGANYGIDFSNNEAGYYGGAVAVDQPAGLPIAERALRYVRAQFVENVVGDVNQNLKNNVRGGGGLYTINADLNVVKGVEFRANEAWNGNGGAVAVVTPDTLTRKRFMVTDLDEIYYNMDGVATGYMPRNDVFTFQNGSLQPDERMLTRFYDNVAAPNMDRMGSGTTQIGDISITHPGTSVRENGTGLGGALYILDSIRVRVDTFSFDRVRMQNNTAFSGSAIYSDNYDLKLAMLRSYITANTATSSIGRSDEKIEGPLVNSENAASSDLAAATIYGELVGPLPWTSYSFAANSIYNNDARFTVRLPDAQDTKGVLAGSTGIGFGGVDTLRGNYWGRTEADVTTVLPASANNSFRRTQETFFIAGNGNTHMQFVRGGAGTQQGPFESQWRLTYTPIDIYTIPDTLLMQGRIYDIFDKGTDIKTADYSKRRMAPIEDFAVGIAPNVKRFVDATQPSFNKYVKRWTRNPFDAEEYDYIAAVQREFTGNHPIGYPLFLEAHVDYSATASISNNDLREVNEQVFFVINERTGDYIRAIMHQRDELDEVYRARVELVPDSTNGADPNQRRGREGLATYGTGATLLGLLRANAIREDSAALAGRVWDGSTTNGELGGANFRLGNRPSLPTSNNGKETFYGGERFRALPVRAGDNVMVVSRTVLWKEGVNSALNGALMFTVNNQTEPPTFTGSGDTLATDATIHPEMRNRVFVTENRLYTPITAAQSRRQGGGSWFNEPVSYPADSAGNAIPSRNWMERDSIFTITAVDANGFYDPRTIMDSTWGAELSYFWRITSPNSALRYWLRDTLVRVSDGDNQAWGARGYLVLRGRPINPYIVPGGEEVEVTTKNFPPSLEIVDSLRSAGYDEEVVSRWFYTYPSYFHAEKYDNNELALGDRNPGNTNARYLQQDSVNYGWLDTTSYRFRIHVVDSMPRFLWAHKPDRFGRQYTEMLAGDTTIVLDPTTTDPNSFSNGEYIDTLRMFVTASRVGRRLTAPNAINNEEYNDPIGNQPDSIDIQFVANLTDSLRFKLDVNTDDEFEDMAAMDANRWVVQQYGAWDFRYGKTAYGFKSVAVRETPGDTTNDEVVMARPVWMANQYLRKFDASESVDPFAEDLSTAGKINIRIAADEAMSILKASNPFNPGNPYHRDLNTDTVMTIVVNDGHGGINQLTRRVFVNVAPEILTASLPDAMEDMDYNVDLLDSGRAISVYDANWGQAREFELIYGSESRDSIPVDPYFPEAGYIVFDESNKTTPEWLKINSKSGLLYGTPRVTDVPFADTTVLVTVLVEDAGGLRDIKSIPLRIEAKNHDPELFESPIISCVELGAEYSDTITVTDIDLARRQAGNEKVTFEVIEPAGSWSITPESIESPVADTQRIVVSNNAISGTPVNGKLTIVVVATDAAGAADTLSYEIAVSSETRFTADIRVQNNLGAFDILTFGVGGSDPATRGDGTDATAPFGKLDSNYCEFELPPVPYVDVFDARWTIPNRNGVDRNIYPFSTDPGEAIYRARFQAGGETGQSSAYYPVSISWCRDRIPATDAANPGSYYIRDDISNGAIFSYNMKTGEGRSAADVIHKTDGSCDTIIISRDALKGFIIVYDYTTSVDDEDVFAGGLAISKSVPNPFATATNITFTVPGLNMVSVEIFDALGNRVATLVNEVLSAGQHTIEWDGTANGTSVANGMYTVRVSDGTATATQQVVLAR